MVATVCISLKFFGNLLQGIRIQWGKQSRPEKGMGWQKGAARTTRLGGEETVQMWAALPVTAHVQAPPLPPRKDPEADVQLIVQTLWAAAGRRRWEC